MELQKQSVMLSFPPMNGSVTVASGPCASFCSLFLDGLPAQPSSFVLQVRSSKQLSLTSPSGGRHASMVALPSCNHRVAAQGCV